LLRQLLLLHLHRHRAEVFSAASRSLTVALPERMAASSSARPAAAQLVVANSPVARDPSTRPALDLPAPVDLALLEDVPVSEHVPVSVVRAPADLVVQDPARAALHLQARRRVHSAHRRIVHAAVDSSIRRLKKAR
jgi:hypothetical protein